MSVLSTLQSELKQKSLDQALKDHFSVIYNSCGTDQLTKAIQMAELIIFGEAHRASHQILHNRVIEEIIIKRASQDLAIGVEERCDAVFNAEAGYPGQLQFVNSEILSSVNIFGYDSPDLIEMLDQSIEHFIEFHKTRQAREIELYDKVVKEVCEAKKAIQALKSNNNLEEALKKTMQDVFIQLVKQRINTAKNYSSLEDSQEKILITECLTIREFIAFSPDCWKLRANSMINISNNLLNLSYDKVVLIGGQLHYLPATNPQVDKNVPFMRTAVESFKKFQEIFENRKVLVLFTPTNLGDIDTFTNSKDLLLKHLLNEHEKNRSKHSEYFENILNSIQNGTFVTEDI